MVATLLVFTLVLAGCDKSPAVTTPPATPAASTLTNAPSATVKPQTTLNPASSAAQIAAKASQALAGLPSYSFSRTISIVQSSTADKSDQTNASVRSQVGLDLAARAMQMDNQIYVKTSTGQMAGPMIESFIYIKNNTMYIQGLFPDNATAWSKTALTDTIWQLQNQAQQMESLLQSGQVTVLAPEMVRNGDLNIPCDVRRSTPDPEALWAFVVNQPGVQLPARAPEGIKYDQIVKSSELKLWVSQSDSLPAQVSLTVSIEVNQSQVPKLPGPILVNLNLNILFGGFNQPMTIDLPAEAGADNVPDLKDLQAQ